MEIKRTLVPIGVRIFEDQQREIIELAEEYKINTNQMYRDILDKGLEALKIGIVKAEYSDGDTISIKEGEKVSRYSIDTGKVLTKLRK